LHRTSLKKHKSNVNYQNQSILSKTLIYMRNVLVIHGPNLNLLGTREPGHYGLDTLESINTKLIAKAKHNDINLETFQSNHEGEIVDKIHSSAQNNIETIILNPAAFTHTSVAIRDALLATKISFIEVHLSNVHAREEFRKKSFFSDVAEGVISGFGANSYLLALESIINKKNN